MAAGLGREHQRARQGPVLQVPPARPQPGDQLRSLRLLLLGSESGEIVTFPSGLELLVDNLERQAYARLPLERRAQDLVALDDAAQGFPEAGHLERAREQEDPAASAARLVLRQPQSLLLG